MLTANREKCGSVIPNCKWLDDKYTKRCNACNQGFKKTSDYKCEIIIENCSIINS